MTDVKKKDFITESKENKPGRPKLGKMSRRLNSTSARKYIKGSETFQDSTFEIVIGEV